jgi:hypothetical protein
MPSAARVTKRRDVAIDVFMSSLLRLSTYAVRREKTEDQLPLPPIIGAAEDPSAMFVDRGHLSERGNEVVGRWLAAELVGALR